MSEADVTIREATAADAQAFSRLLAQLRQESTTFEVVGDPQEDAQQAAELAQMHDANRHLMLVAELEGELIGLVNVSPTPTADTAEIGVAVVKNHWNQGLGTALIMAGLDWAALESDYEIVTLTVQEKNEAAHHVYSKIGFTTVGRSKVTDPSGHLVAALEMQIRVK